MHKFRVLLETEKGNLDVGQACAMLSTSPRTLGQMLTLWKGRLRLITPIIDKLLEPVNTKHDQAKLKEKLAELMGTTYRQVNRLLSTSGIDVPAPQTSVVRLKKHEMARNRIQRSEKYALDVVAGLSDAENAAESAEVSRRQMYRLAGNFIALEGYRFLDLRRMTMEQRKQLADRIEHKLRETAHV